MSADNILGLVAAMLLTGFLIFVVIFSGEVLMDKYMAKVYDCDAAAAKPLATASSRPWKTSPTAYCVTQDGW